MKDATFDKRIAAIHADETLDDDEKQKRIMGLTEKRVRENNDKLAKQRGTVYTPIEVVDFINNSIEHVLNTEFGVSMKTNTVSIKGFEIDAMAAEVANDNLGRAWKDKTGKDIPFDKTVVEVRDTFLEPNAKTGKPGKTKQGDLFD